MYTFSTKRRTAAASAAGVMAVGALVAFGPVSAADAAVAAPTNYVCTSKTNLAVPAKVVGRVSLPARIKHGRSLAGRAASMRVTLPDQLIHGLQSTLGFTYLSGTVKGAALQVTKPGVNTRLPLGALRIPQTTVPPAGSDMVLTATGKTARTAHAPSKPGRYLVRMPKTFTFDPKSDAQIQTGPLSCVLKGKAGSFGYMRVLR